MALVDRKSDLTSLKFGKDRRGGGHSGQPFITTDIPARSQSINFATSFLGNDFLNRGGVISLPDTLKDQERLLKYFTGVGKSADGLIFIAKQKLLAKQNPITGAGPDRTYNFASTIAQAGVLARGQHYMKDGKDLIMDSSNTYLQKTKNPEEYNSSTLGVDNRNKLLLLYENKIVSTSNTVGANSSQVLDNELRILGEPGVFGNTARREAYRDTENAESKAKAIKKNLSNFGISEDRNVLFEYQGGPNATVGGKTVIRRNVEYDTTKAFNDNQKINNNPGKILAYSPFQLSSVSNRIGIQFTTGFSKGIKGEDGNIYNSIGNFQTKFKSSTAKKNRIGNPVDYTDFNRSETYGIGNPGKQGRNKSIYYTTNIKEVGKGKATEVFDYDKINAKTLYSSESPSATTDSTKDIIKFHIGAINIDSPQELTWTHFRAYNLSFNDQYASDWQEYKYTGRGNPYYKYNGYTRNISMGFEVFLQSRYEQPVVYSKLNYLASLTAPNYSTNGYMRGNILKITIGDYLNGVYGILRGITYSIPDDATWDIAKDNEGKTDPNASELPMRIKVDNFQFTPIHNFYDRSVENINGKPQQRFISMGSNGEGYPESKLGSLNNSGDAI